MDTDVQSNKTLLCRGGLTTHGAPHPNRGSWNLCVLDHTQSTPKKSYKRYQGHFMGPPTDPGPSDSSRVL
ncbi:unnamed protein product [Staurois parvus]|uniref:Uncharacterized protein n=1 Tax=Staurois parvus TaxID=386267 RepID=A0ABN9G672_9NEOB|nr:unnamed protein product [Staurois parvus]